MGLEDHIKDLGEILILEKEDSSGEDEKVLPENIKKGEQISSAEKQRERIKVAAGLTCHPW